ncbi:MAG: Glycosyltransferase, partial [uncultured bacterium]
VLEVPLLYYSLELYVEGHPAFDGKSEFVALREEERLWHAKAAATIVQDAARGAVLLKSNGLDASMDVIYLPVSVSGPAFREGSRFLHDRLSLDPARKIILYFGSVSRNRGIDEVIRHACGIDSSFEVVLHGPVAQDITSEERRNERVIFSCGFVDDSEVPALIASAHIGLSFYRNNVVNDRLTAFSSEKMALYLQSGVPVIAYANESYELLMEHYRCGELIRDMSELPAAVERIEADYEGYRENALSAFERFYRCENNLRSVYAYLSRETTTGADANVPFDDSQSHDGTDAVRR